MMLVLIGCFGCFKVSVLVLVVVGSGVGGGVGVVGTNVLGVWYFPLSLLLLLLFLLLLQLLLCWCLCCLAARRSNTKHPPFKQSERAIKPAKRACLLFRTREAFDHNLL